MKPFYSLLCRVVRLLPLGYRHQLVKQLHAAKAFICNSLLRRPRFHFAIMAALALPFKICSCSFAFLWQLQILICQQR